MASSWSSLVGMESVCEKWRRLLQEGRLPTCILLTGQAGIGKKHLLHRLAALFYCDQGGCGTCTTCQHIDGGFHTDVLHISAESLSLQEAVELQRHVEMHPLLSANCKQPGGARIVLVPDIERWTRQGVNRLLKTLEELPPYAYVFFSTSSPKRLLPTVLSRCVRFPVTGERIAAPESEEERQWSQEINAFWEQVFSASMPADILGHEIWNRKGAAVRVANSVEAALNRWYRHQLDSGQAITGVRIRREGLRAWKKRAIQEKIMINGQLAAEVFALQGLGSRR